MCTFKAAESKRLTETKLIFNMCITNLKYEGGDRWNLQYDFEVTEFFFGLKIQLEYMLGENFTYGVTDNRS